MVVPEGVVEDGPVSAPSCWLSNSTSCCSRSISMIKGTRRMRKAVPAIQAALPALYRCDKYGGNRLETRVTE